MTAHDPDKPQIEAAARQAECLAKAVNEARAQAYAEAFEQGRTEGFATGRANGYEKGQQQGYAAGLAEGQQAALAEAATLRAVLQHASANLEKLGNDISAAVSQLAIAIAQQVIQTELKQQPETIINLVRQVLRIVPTNGGLLYIHLHPDDAQLACAHLGHGPGEERWRLVPDNTIQPGGCHVRTTLGEVDATLQTRWRRVLATLNHNADEVNA